MSFRTSLAVVSLVVMTAYSSASYSHGGGVDKNGCHKDSGTNTRHCHGSSNSPESSAHKAVNQEKSPPDSYDRDSWRHWSDLDGDGRDTREQMMAEQSMEKVIYRPGTDTIVRGLWRGAHTGKVAKKASAFHIDHVIPLAYASRAGGRTWTPEKKEAFANDPINLLITTASANMSKSDRGPEKWMPSMKKIHCTYLSQWIQVSRKYQLQLNLETRKFILSRKDCFPTR